MPWSVKGVGPDARELAKAAASERDATMGDWLSDVIRRVGAAEAAGRPLVPAARPVDLSPPSHPIMAPVDHPESGGPLDDEALVDLVSERVERSEGRILEVLTALEDIVERLANRLDRLEESLDSPPPDDDAYRRVSDRAL